MDAAKIIGADARLAGLALLSSPDGNPRVALDRLELDHIAGEVAGMTYRADALVLEKLEARPARGQITAAAVHLTGLQLSSTDGNVRVSFPHIGFPSGFQLKSNHELFAPHVSLEDGQIEIRDLAALRTRPQAGADGNGGGSTRAQTASGPQTEPGSQARARAQTASGPQTEPGSQARARAQTASGPHAGPDPQASTRAQTASGPQAEPGPQAGPDFRFFDALSGHLNIDLVVDLTLPWIGRRRATHYFRVPIKDGTIDFARLENDVHWLEGAFLTLDVIDDKLVLARDLPLVPYAGKALLQWRLEPADVPLARYQRVHLRNLLRWEVPPRPRDKGKSRVILHAIAMEKIRLHLNANAPAVLELRNGSIIQFGDEAQPGLVDLSVSGALRYSTPQPPAPTTLHGSMGLLDMTIKELVLGAAALSADRLHIGRIDRVDVGFEGFQPRSLSAAVERLAATNLRVHLSRG